MSDQLQLLETFMQAARSRPGPLTAEAALALPEARAILRAAPETRAAIVVRAVQELFPPAGGLGRLFRGFAGAHDYLTMRYLEALVAALLRAHLPFTFAGQRLVATNIAQSLDGADMTEWMVEHVLKPRSVAYHRLYEREGLASPQAAEGALTRASAATELDRGYGLVFWAGHGMPTRVVRTVWNDADHDGVALAELSRRHGALN